MRRSLRLAAPFRPSRPAIQATVSPISPRSRSNPWIFYNRRWIVGGAPGRIPLPESAIVRSTRVAAARTCTGARTRADVRTFARADVSRRHRSTLPSGQFQPRTLVCPARPFVSFLGATIKTFSPTCRARPSTDHHPLALSVFCSRGASADKACRPKRATPSSTLAPFFHVFSGASSSFSIAMIRRVGGQLDSYTGGCFTLQILAVQGRGMAIQPTPQVYPSVIPLSNYVGPPSDGG